MKKILVFCIFLVLLTGVVNAETKLSMELWNRWTYLMVDGADDAVQNELSLPRASLILEQKFSDKISGKFMVDFFSKGISPVEISGDEVDEISNDGAGVKLKLAYVKFSKYLWKDADFYFGLIPTYFGTLYDWGYPTIDLNPTDRYGFVSSADYGMAISGKFPGEFGEYQVAAYNGEGYTKTCNDIDTNLAFLGNLRLTPIKGITVGGSYCIDTKATQYQKYIDTVIDSTMGYDFAIDDWEVLYDTTDTFEEVDYDMVTNKMAGFLRFNMVTGVDIWAQYLTRTSTAKSWCESTSSVEETDKTVNVISFMPIINIKEYTDFDMEIVFRYDMYDDDADMNDEEIGSGAYDIITAGVNYFMLRDDKNNPKLWLQANYTMRDNKDKELDDCSDIKVQLRWKFSGVID